MQFNYICRPKNRAVQLLSVPEEVIITNGQLQRRRVESGARHPPDVTWEKKLTSCFHRMYFPALVSGTLLAYSFSGSRLQGLGLGDRGRKAKKNLMATSTTFFQPNITKVTNGVGGRNESPSLSFLLSFVLSSPSCTRSVIYVGKKRVLLSKLKETPFVDQPAFHCNAIPSSASVRQAGKH